MNKKQTIVVTGGLGHIGSSLIRELPKDLVENIIILDNLESQRYCSLFNLPEDFKYTFLEEDIREADLENILKDADLVVHLAALTDAASSHGRAKEVESVNFDGLKRVAQACQKTNTKLLFPSTTSVYGSQENVVDENCKELKPQSPYAEAKLASEEYLSSLDGLNYTVCRFGTIFGYSIGMRFHTAVNKFTWQAINGQPLTVWKTAWEQKRPYLYLGDCVRAINFIIKNNLFNGELFNVLTSNFAVKDIVDTIKEYIPDLEVSYVDSPIMNQLSYDVNDDKFRSKGYTSEGDIKKGIGETIDILKQIIINK